jgi:hypothetical protein
MTAISATAPRFDIGRVINRTFGVIGRNLVVFSLLALLLSGLPELVRGGLQMQFMNGASPSDSSRLLGVLFGMIGSSFVYLGCMFVLQAAIMHGVIADLNGRKASLGECLGTGVRFLLPLLGITVLLGLALMVGFVLFIVPGVLMALAWIVAAPAEVVERTGILGAFRRSADLTRNHRGAIFGLAVLAAVLGWILSLTVLATTGGFQAIMTGHYMSWTTVIVAALLQAVQLLINSAGTAAIYYELRSIKEGIGPEALAAVFD